jgi:hypothetical protein
MLNFLAANFIAILIVGGLYYAYTQYSGERRSRRKVKVWYPQWREDSEILFIFLWSRYFYKVLQHFFSVWTNPSKERLLGTDRALCCVNRDKHATWKLLEFKGCEQLGECPVYPSQHIHIPSAPILLLQPRSSSWVLLSVLVRRHTLSIVQTLSCQEETTWQAPLPCLQFQVFRITHCPYRIREKSSQRGMR